MFDSLKQIAINGLVYISFLILISTYLNYVMLNFTRCLASLDWKLMDNNEALFYSFGNPIASDPVCEKFDEKVKFCCCMTGTASARS